MHWRWRPKNEQNDPNQKWLKKIDSVVKSAFGSEKSVFKKENKKFKKIRKKSKKNIL